MMEDIRPSDVSYTLDGSYGYMTVKADLSEGSQEALRAMIHQEVRAALDLEEYDARIGTTLELCKRVLSEVPVEMECDADWRARRDDALAQVEGLLITRR